ncbi:MAG: putative addiction module antidote protein [Candidatus Electrothrix sp. MAN1_4]|nr:putative addiction module antidote protein [Candidatus Electrothrix sp. MAN1_4]
MKVITSEWDASEYLESSEMMKEYLQIMLEENGVEGFQRALGDIAKAKGMTEIALKTKLGRQNLYKALSEGSSPKFDTVKKVVEALGCKIAIV